MKFAKLIVCVSLAGVAALAQALDIKPYSEAALAQAQAAGTPIALHFRADWCPTCRAQDKVLDSLKNDKNLNLTLLSVDYDNEKALERRFHVNMQSTFIVLKGQKEEARLVGDTRAEAIRAALKSAL